MRLPLDLPARGGKRFDVVGCGVNMVDLLVTVGRYPAADTKQPVERLEYAFGGQVASAMAACARLGHRACYVGRFGDDAHGIDARTDLEGERVDTARCLVASNTPNGFSVVLVDRDRGTRTVMSSRASRLALRPEEIDRAAVCAGRTLLVDCHDTAASTTAARYAREATIPTLVDVEQVRPGIEDLLAHIDVIVAAEEFPAALTGKSAPGAALRALQDSCQAAVVCMTLGKDGSLARVGNVEIRTRSFSVPVVDTTGAGDAFRGGFIAGWLRGGDMTPAEEILRYANAVAALKCRGPGARRALPRAGEVDAILRRGSI